MQQNCIVHNAHVWARVKIRNKIFIVDRFLPKIREIEMVFDIDIA